MSTLVAQTISNGTVSTSSANVIQGSARVWVSFNGSTLAIRGSYNASSITRVATGRFTVNFTNALPNANYATVAAGGSPASRDGYAMIPEGTNPTTTAVNVRTTGSNAPDGTADLTYTSVVVFSS
jgi:hypothetical protein